LIVNAVYAVKSTLLVFNTQGFLIAIVPQESVKIKHFPINLLLHFVVRLFIVQAFQNVNRL